MTKVEKNDTTLGEYVYDGGGKRIQVTENGETGVVKFLGAGTFQLKVENASYFHFNLCTD